MSYGKPSSAGSTRNTGEVARIAAFAPSRVKNEARGTRGGAGLVLAASGGSLEVVATREFDESNAVASFLTFAQESGAAQVVVLTTIASTLAKAMTIPSAQPSEAAGAAALLCDAHLPGSIAEYRRGGGVIGSSPAASAAKSGLSHVLLTGWVQRTDEAIPSEEVLYCTPIAALSMLMGHHAAGAILDVGAGDGAVLVVGGDKAVARIVLHDDDESAVLLTARALAYAAQSAGVVHDEIPNVSGAVCLTMRARADLSRRVRGVRDDQAWLDTFGPALGAAMVLANPPSAGLARLRRSAPIVREAAVVRSARWLAVGSHWVLLIFLSVLGLLLLPFGIAHAHNAFLAKRADIIEKVKVQNADIEKRAGMYAQLEANRLPLTKILADLSACTPVGVTATDVRLNPEQGLVIDGTAQSVDLVNKFQSNLIETRMFRKPTINRTETNSEGGVSFNLTGEFIPEIVFTPIKPPDDFSEKTLALRLHGEGGTAVVAGGSTPKPDTSVQGRRGDRKVEEGADGGSGGGGGLRTDELPPVLTDEEIGKLNFRQATTGWVVRSTYVKKNETKIDAATKQRLQDEETKLRAQADAQRSKASGGAK
jgi:Tfp pilus assembly protein PilN